MECILAELKVEDDIEKRSKGGPDERQGQGRLLKGAVPEQKGKRGHGRQNTVAGNSGSVYESPSEFIKSWEPSRGVPFGQLYL